MNLKPSSSITDSDVKRGLRLVIVDGLAAEAMTSFTGGVFLVSMAILLGASNFQIGLLAALPTFTNIFQLISIWLVRRYNNRRVVAVVCGLLARFPLIVVGLLPLLFHSSVSFSALLPFLFLYYFFGSIAGPSWNSWMKDLVPDQELGKYFSRRNSYTQSLNLILSIGLALLIDYVKSNQPEAELETYGYLFITGGVIGIAGSLILSLVKEPQSFVSNENTLKLFSRPLKDINFRRLLIFNSGWVFALNLATPFFTVFLLKSIGLSLSYIIVLGIISQICSILTIRTWGRLADRYSNKTIISIAAPLYILCIVGWCFVGIYSSLTANLILLAIIHMISGVATSGVNLSLTNIGLKLAPKGNAIVYLSARNMVTALFSSIAPLVGGLLADYFVNRSLTINAQWVSPNLDKVFHLVALHEWNFLFLIGALLALFVLELLSYVKEIGEVEKDLVVRIMRTSLKSNLKDFFVIGTLISWHDQFWAIVKRTTLGESGPPPSGPVPPST